MFKKSDLVQHMRRLDEAKKILAQQEREKSDRGESERLEKQQRLYKFMFGKDCRAHLHLGHLEKGAAAAGTTMGECVEKPVIVDDDASFHTCVPKKARMEESSCSRENSVATLGTQFPAGADSSSDRT